MHRHRSARQSRLLPRDDNVRSGRIVQSRAAVLPALAALRPGPAIRFQKQQWRTIPDIHNLSPGRSHRWLPAEHTRERPPTCFLPGKARRANAAPRIFGQPAIVGGDNGFLIYPVTDPDLLSGLLEYVQAHGAKMTALKGCNLPGTSMVGRNGRFPAAAIDRPAHVSIPGGDRMSA